MHSALHSQDCNRRVSEPPAAVAVVGVPAAVAADGGVHRDCRGVTGVLDAG